MEKFNIGDYVVYGMRGTCKVNDICELDFGDEGEMYYSLSPVFDRKSTLYVAVSRQDDVLRSVISPIDAKEVFEEAKEIAPAKTLPDKEALYKILEGGNCLEVSKMIKLLRQLRVDNRKSHKGLNIQEEKYLRDAENIFFSEMATALQMTKEDVIDSFGNIIE